MRQVREQQGPDAVILSSRRVGDEIEVVAAIDYDASLLDAAPRCSAGRQQPKPEVAPPRERSDWSREPSLVDMKQEVASLRKLLESQLGSLTDNETLRVQPARPAIAQEMESLGISPALAAEIAETAADQTAPVSAALRDLQDRLPVMQREIVDEPGAVALVGPTGVGKTTTIAKLAARFALKHGAGQLGLVTTDGFRIGAQEQLLTFGRILGVPVKLVRDGAELTDTLAAMGDKRLVLIDSAGMGQRDRRIHAELAAIIENGDAVRVLLTLSATAQRGVLQETVAAFRALDPAGCVLTKVDEAASLGGAISTLIANELPLAYITDGQAVPEDLHRAGGKRCNLVERALELKRDAEDHYPEVAHG